MIVVHEYAGKEVAVLGLGRSGISAAQALKAGGAIVHAWDDNEETRAKAEAVGITLSDINKRDWQNFAALVLSPGVPYRFPQPHRVVRMAEMIGVPVVGDIELFARAIAAQPEAQRPKLVGITGTNGKSTTTALIGHILKSAGRDARIGGNIGTGALDLAALHPNAIYVLELSSYQLDLVSTLRCDVAVLLNLSPDHIDRHGSMEGYRAAKLRIFNNQLPGDTAVIGFDDVETQSIAIGMSGAQDRKVVMVSSTYTMPGGVSAVSGKLYDGPDARSRLVGDLAEAPALAGRHNHQNAAAAFAACRALGLSADVIMKGMRSFPGLPHRMETVGVLEGVRFINDSKATNAQATEQALRTYSNVYWIAGGIAKEGGIAPLQPLYNHITRAYLIGEAQDAFAETLKGKVPAQKCGTLETAIAAAFKDARSASDSHPIILLSPACASFDQFRDFEHRGDHFRTLVQAMLPPDLKVSA
jgi:UDP-N-acetylmuramoylalanine--D-glutamate ligase